MIVINGLFWPDDVGQKWQHALAHVRSLEVSVARCQAARRLGTAVQAGGNVGLWPRRLAEVFARVITFEPDAASRACLEVNVPAPVEIWSAALGDVAGWCGIAHKSLGSHKVIEGSSVPMVRVDDLKLKQLDLLQLDVEGSEAAVLRGAADTIARCRPVIHLELRDLNAAAGCGTADIRAWLGARGYAQVATAPGSDVIFEARP